MKRKQKSYTRQKRYRSQRSTPRSRSHHRLKRSTIRSRSSRRHIKRARSPSVRGGGFEQLPPEILQHIGSFLGDRVADRVPHIARASQVDKASYRAWRNVGIHTTVKAAAATFIRRMFAQRRGAWVRIVEYVSAFSDDEAVNFLTLIHEVSDVPYLGPSTMLSIWNSGKPRFSAMFTKMAKAGKSDIMSSVLQSEVARTALNLMDKGQIDDLDKLTAHFGTDYFNILGSNIALFRPTPPKDIRWLKYIHKYEPASSNSRYLIILRLFTAFASQDIGEEILREIPTIGLSQLFMCWGNMSNIGWLVERDPTLINRRGNAKFDFEFFSMARRSAVSPIELRAMENPYFWLHLGRLCIAGLRAGPESQEVLLNFLRTNEGRILPRYTSIPGFGFVMSSHPTLRNEMYRQGFHIRT